MTPMRANIVGRPGVMAPETETEKAQHNTKQSKAKQSKGY
jgi:hypothetical protein